MSKFFKYMVSIAAVAAVLFLSYQYFNRPPSDDQTKLTTYLSSKKTVSNQVLRDMKKLSKPELRIIQDKYDIAQEKINAFIDTIIFKASLGDNDVSIEIKNLSEVDKAIYELKDSVSSLKKYSMEAFDSTKLYMKKGKAPYIQDNHIISIIRELPEILRDEERRKIIVRTLEKYKWDSF